MDLFIHVSRFDTDIYQCEKFFYLKDRIVKLPAKPHTKDIREHHSHTIAKDSHAVNIFFLIIFRMGASKSRSTLLSLYSDIYHTKYGKNIISIFHAIALSLNIDTCHIAYGIVSRHDKITLPALASNSDCTPKSSHVITQPRQ